jgi:cytoskeleton protein RodZ
VSLGRRLAAARAERGLDLEDVSRATRIRVPILRALEADDRAAAGPAVYVRGHLRTLAGLLGLDPAVLVAEYERGAASSPEVPQAWQVRDPVAARADRRSPNWLGATVVTMAAVVGLLVVGTLVEPDDRVTVATPPPAAAEPAAPGAPGDDGTGTEPGTDADTGTGTDADADTGADEAEGSDADGSGSDTGGSSAEGAGGSGGGSTSRGSSGGSSSADARPVEVRPVEVRVSVADGRSWLEVTDATGRSLHGAVLEDGDAEEFTADRELRLTVGDASAVRVEVDGRRVDVRGGEGDIAKLRVRPGGRVTAG